MLTSFDPTLFSAAAAPTCTTAACTSLVRGTGNELNGIAVAGALQISLGVIARPKRELTPATAIPFNSLPVPRTSEVQAAVVHVGAAAALKSVGSNDVSTLFYHAPA